MDNLVSTVDDGFVTCFKSASGNVAVTPYTNKGVMGETFELNVENVNNLIRRLELSRESILSSQPDQNPTTS